MHASGETTRQRPTSGARVRSRIRGRSVSLCVEVRSARGLSEGCALRGARSDREADRRSGRAELTRPSRSVSTLELPDRPQQEERRRAAQGARALRQGRPLARDAQPADGARLPTATTGRTAQRDYDITQLRRRRRSRSTTSSTAATRGRCEGRSPNFGTRPSSSVPRRRPRRRRVDSCRGVGPNEMVPFRSIAPWAWTVPTATGRQLCRASPDHQPRTHRRTFRFERHRWRAPCG
jgi:hypothetical protein